MAAFVTLIIGLTSSTLFFFLIIFLLVFFSRTCRFSDYGFSYYFTMIIAVGFTYGIFPALILGFLPFLLVPKIRPDMQIIDIIISSILMTLVGIASGIFSHFPDLPFATIGIVILVIYNVVRFIALYGKYHMTKLSISFFINIGLNYYLITFYLLKLMGVMGYTAA